MVGSAKLSNVQAGLVNCHLDKIIVRRKVTLPKEVIKGKKKSEQSQKSRMYQSNFVYVRLIHWHLEIYLSEQRSGYQKNVMK